MERNPRLLNLRRERPENAAMLKSAVFKPIAAISFLMLANAAQVCAFTCDAGYRFSFGKTVDGTLIDFAYSGARGPEHWASLAPKGKWAMCDEGERQAPIAISPRGAIAAQIGIDFHYSQDIHFVDHSDALGADHGGGNYIVIDGTRYDLIQIHYHQPAETILNGHTYPLELHLVHRSAAGVLAVVGVFIEKGRADKGILSLPGNPRLAAEPVIIKASSLLPARRSFFRFNGSLTTPGCDQPVLFNVMEHPIQMSSEQIAAFACGIENSARPVQKLNRRFVLYG